MPILKKVLLAFGIIILVGVAQSGLIVWNLRELADEIDIAVSKPIVQVDAARTAWSSYQEANDYLTRTLDGIRFQASEESIATFDVLATKIEKELERFASTAPSAEAMTLASQATTTAKAWEENARILLGVRAATEIPAPHMMERLRSQIKQELQGLVAQALTEAESAKGEVRAHSGNTQFWVISLSLAAAAIGLCLAVPLALALTKPLAQFEQRMRKLIEGDVDSEIADQERNDEIGRVAKALSYLKERLIERNALEKQAAELHRINEEKLRGTEAAYAAAGKDQAAIVQELETAIVAVAQGKLTARITAEVAPAYEKLKNDFNAAIGNLENIVRLVAATTSDVRAEADEIAQASGDLSKRTEQQAASLEETAGALEVILTTVKKTADGATRAKHSVDTANAEAENGAQVVCRAIEAMNRIEKSSGQIHQIIGVIDEIAFQTNLLALNAGVEAARAGEAGRGFAVIATEVRALAQRAAAAAKEIKSLVTNSTGEVEQGVDLVAKTGKALELIAAQVVAISKVVNEIASDAKDQADGLHHVNSEIGQINLVTQQNAAMVEKSTSGTYSLKTKAGELAKGLDKFEIAQRQDTIIKPQFGEPARRAKRFATL